MNEPPVEELNSFADDCIPPEDSYESREVAVYGARGIIIRCRHHALLNNNR